ncbi:MAG: dipeptide epimerase [Verrucomicrobia bacterium]|nr:dipeptide epimerase [Verrucomicrobiota bacterium]
MTLREFELPLKHTFTISRDSKRVARTLIVELGQDGRRGYGEAPESGYYGATLAETRGALEGARPAIERARLEDPARLWEQLRPVLGGHAFAQCAVDEAAHDLWGKCRGQPVWKLWGLDCNAGPLTDYTIGIDTIDVMVAKMQELPNWPIYKIKLGTPHDIEIVEALRRHSQAVFRIDANAGWTVAETLHKAPRLKELGVEFIEQPLPPDDWTGMKEVFARCALPVIADETCRAESDVDRCRECFHGINIKVVKCGGLTPARRMIARAQHLGLKTMVGCMTESTVGISAIAQLRPMLDYVDMDGALLLAKDIASGVTIEQGRVRYPKVNGCGVRLCGA